MRARASGAPASWGGVDGRGGSVEGRGGSRGAGRKGSYEGATRADGEARRRGARRRLCPPAANAWRWRERRRVAKNLARLVDHYDRRCLRSARARALQEGLAFGASEDRTVAWLIFSRKATRRRAPRRNSRGRSARGTIAHARALRGRRNVRVAVAMGTRGPRSRGGGFTARVASYGDDGQRVGRRTPARASKTARLSPRRPETLPRERNVAAEAKRRSWWTTVGASAALDGGRVGGADAAFTFALTPGEPNSPRREPNASRSRPSRITASNDDDDDDLLAIRSTARDVFAAVEGAENLSRFLSDEANPALFRHGVALTLAAFFPPADDPFGGFRLGVVVHRPDDAPSTPALPPSTPQTAFDIRSPRARLRFGGDSDDDENQPGAEPDEGNDASGYGASPSDAERGDGDSPCESPGGGIKRGRISRGEGVSRRGGVGGGGGDARTRGGQRCTRTRRARRRTRRRTVHVPSKPRVAHDRTRRSGSGFDDASGFHAGGFEGERVSEDV